MTTVMQMMMPAEPMPLRIQAAFSLVAMYSQSETVLTLEEDAAYKQALTTVRLYVAGEDAAGAVVPYSDPLVPECGPQQTVYPSPTNPAPLPHSYPGGDSPFQQFVHPGYQGPPFPPMR